jgi:hypothetical protein
MASKETLKFCEQTEQLVAQIAIQEWDTPKLHDPGANVQNCVTT